MDKRATDELKKRGETLDAGSFNGAIQVVHQDGSTMFFNYAFAEEFEKWWLVFTEHCGHHAFYTDDLSFIRCYGATTYEYEYMGPEDD
jgi:hypothetical protein